MTEFRFFSEDKCTRCGECFTRCQYLDLDRKTAIDEIERLIAGRPTKKVMDKCASCYACNAFCPEDADPYFLILEKWHRRYTEKGLPARASYLLPYHEPNYRTDMEANMSAREKEMLEKWKASPAEGEFLYPGCNLMTAPYIWDIPALRDLPVSGDWSLCCGEPLFRMGLFDEMEKIAEGLTNYYADKDIKKMVFVCPACLNMFRNVLPERFGAKLDFECEYIADWLLREMDEGSIEVTKPLGRKVAVHDSCHSRVMGDEISESSRELMRRLGAETINMKHHHEDGLCCGIAAGCNRYMPQDIMLASLRELKEGTSTGAPEMGIYCGGCFIMMNIARNVFRTGQELVHMLEYVAEATGGPTPRTIRGRTMKMLVNITVKAIPKMLSAARYKVGEPEVKGRR